MLIDREEVDLDAFVLVNSEAGILWQVLEDVLRVEGVKTAYAVTGQFDEVVLIQFMDLGDMGKIIERINQVNGVLRTQTLLAIPPPSETNPVMSNVPEEEKMGPTGYSDM
jgi:DNA-binding Lrp family transcriptional regulator